MVTGSLFQRKGEKSEIGLFLKDFVLVLKITSRTACWDLKAHRGTYGVMRLVKYTVEEPG